MMLSLGRFVTDVGRGVVVGLFLMQGGSSSSLEGQRVRLGDKQEQGLSVSRMAGQKGI